MSTLFLYELIQNAQAGDMASKLILGIFVLGILSCIISIIKQAAKTALFIGCCILVYGLLQQYHILNAEQVRYFLELVEDGVHNLGSFANYMLR